MQPAQLKESASSTRQVLEGFDDAEAAKMALRVSVSFREFLKDEAVKHRRNRNGGPNGRQSLGRVPSHLFRGIVINRAA